MAEEVGRTIGLMLLKLLGLKREGVLSAIQIRQTNAELLHLSGLDVDLMVTEDETGFELYVLSHCSTAVGLTALSEYLAEVAWAEAGENSERAHTLLLRSLQLLTMADHRSHELSVQRLMLRDRITDSIRQNQ